MYYYLRSEILSLWLQYYNIQPTNKYRLLYRILAALIFQLNLFITLGTGTTNNIKAHLNADFEILARF
jgi:hypothetical protein